VPVCKNTLLDSTHVLFELTMVGLGRCCLFHSHICVRACMHWTGCCRPHNYCRVCYVVGPGRWWFSTPIHAFKPVCMNGLLETIRLLLGLHKWSARGAVDVFHTHNCALSSLISSTGFPFGRPLLSDHGRWGWISTTKFLPSIMYRLGDVPHK